MLENQLINLAGTLKKAPDIMGKFRKYKNAGVMLTLFFHKGEWCFVFQKRAEDIPQGGEICFPGGLYDPGKDMTMKDTALRETAEELGIKQERVRIIGRLDTLIVPSGFTIDPFIGILEIKQLDDLNRNHDEVSDVFLMPLTYFLDNSPEIYNLKVAVIPEGLPSAELGLPDRYTRPWNGPDYPVYYFRTDYGPLWGITAELIQEFLSLVQMS